MNPDDLNKLLPCPFCGGGAEIRACADEMNEGGYFVSCEVCLACSRIQFGEDISEELHGAWNARANTALRKRAERSSSLHAEVIRAGILLGEKEQRIAALEADLRIQDEANNILTKRLDEAKADVAALVSRKVDLEAERAALMSAGKVAVNIDYGQFHDQETSEREKAALAVFEEKPGALAAWMAKEGR